jgi:hypothetical protein
MSMNPFTKKKRLREEIQRQQQEARRQLEDQLSQIEKQLELERRIHEEREKQLEQERYVRERQLEQERLARAIQEQEELARERRERQVQWEAEQKEREQRDREQRRQERLKLTSPDALRGLRDLIRTRYALDIEIWSLKGARKPDRPIVEGKMEKADAVLMEIYNMVATWEENDKVWTPQEWELARDIKARILAEGKRQWKDNPPWNEY